MEESVTPFRCKKNSLCLRPETVSLFFWFIVIGAGLQLTAEAPQAQDRTTRAYSLHAPGTLVLNVPSSWREEMKKAQSDAPPTITFRPPAGQDFIVMITALKDPKGNKDFNSPETVRKLMEVDRDRIKSRAVESDIGLRTLKGPNMHGTYFSVTDKKPEPGEYEYLTRAGVGVGDLLLSVSVLTHDRNSPAIDDTLSMLEDAKVEREKPQERKTRPRP